jgi:nitrogen fixation protein
MNAAFVFLQMAKALTDVDNEDRLDGNYILHLFKGWKLVLKLIRIPSACLLALVIYSSGILQSISFAIWSKAKLPIFSTAPFSFI